LPECDAGDKKERYSNEERERAIFRQPCKLAYKQTIAALDSR